MTSSHPALIRHASTLPKGSEERRAIRAGQKQAHYGYQTASGKPLQ